jgi:hypothetical protein
MKPTIAEARRHIAERLAEYRVPGTVSYGGVIVSPDKLEALLDALSQAEGVIERAHGLTVVNKTPQGFVKSYAPNLEALDGLHGDCATFLSSLKGRASD